MLVSFIRTFVVYQGDMEFFGKYYYLDGNIYKAGQDEEIPSGEVSFYEVIRTRGGVPLFFRDHMDRLEEGISTRYEIRKDLSQEISKGLNALVKKEAFDEINVKVTVSFAGREYSVHIYYIRSSYPSDEMIRKGAHLILYHAERFDPSVKLLNNRLRLSVDEALQKRKAYEALLVNHEGYITEGSRSNVFFVTGKGIVQTAPDSMVLSGITRKYVIELCMKDGIEVVFKAVRAEDISRFQSVFITGTSPMVLPVKSIGSHLFGPFNRVIENLRLGYEGMAADSIIRYRLGENGD
jgi:branched-chain amino acid aminotransferase